MIDKLVKEFPRATYIMCAVFVVLVIINLLSGVSVQFNEKLAWHFFYTMIYGYSLYYANSVIFIKLDAFYNENRFTKKRIIIGFCFSFIVSLFVIFCLRFLEDVVIEGKTVHYFLKNEKASNYIVASLITFVVTLAIHAFYFYKAYQENRVQQEKIIAGNASAQFESLKNQLDPHFLFNSLNVLNALIEENPKNAQKFTTSLSKIYRYVLEQRDKELVSVTEELQFAKTYMNLLKMRFENSITFEMPDIEIVSNLAITEEAKVVPLALQLLLENAIKHNVVSEQKQLHIKIYIIENHLIVENNLQKKETLQNRKGVGLQNIVDRYAIITTRKVFVEETENSFKIKIPILTKQLNIMEKSINYKEDNPYYRAKKRVEELKGFYSSALSYCLVIPLLIFINYKTTSFQWFWFPMLGWGMGLAFHAFAVFGYGKSWEEKKIQEIMNKENDSFKKWN